MSNMFFPFKIKTFKDTMKFQTMNVKTVLIHICLNLHSEAQTRTETCYWLEKALKRNKENLYMHTYKHIILKCFITKHKHWLVAGSSFMVAILLRELYLVLAQNTHKSTLMLGNHTVFILKIL